jgi:hypothetical protein|nr:MAG TPA: hypothetical protein [Caudoviricetes sp.]
MVQRYDFCDRYGNKLHESESDSGEFVSYGDYEKLDKSVRACVAAIREGSLTVEHVHGYLEGLVEVLDGR